MKKILLFALLISPLTVFAQKIDTLGYLHHEADSTLILRVQSDNSSISEKDRANINSVHHILGYNERILKRSYISKQDLLYNAQQATIPLNQLPDSIANIYRPEITFYRRIGGYKAPSYTMPTNLESGPYEILRINLDLEMPHRSLTIFYGIDLNFANGRLEHYLQNKMSLSSQDFDVNNDTFTIKYAPRVSDGKEFLNVAYTTRKDNGKVPYLPTDDGTTNIITSCTITGTADLVLELFLGYWPQKIKLGGYKQGEIAHFEFMGDRVSLYGVSPPATYKIEIDKGNITADYYSTFKIK